MRQGSSERADSAEDYLSFAGAGVGAGAGAGAGTGTGDPLWRVEFWEKR